MEQYGESLKRAAILADFERRLRDALTTDDPVGVEGLSRRYLERYPWLAAEVYRKVYLRGRRRALEARIRTYDRLLAGHNPHTVRYLSEGWRRQRDEAAAEVRDLEAAAALDPPPWPRVLAQLQAHLRETGGGVEREA
ncbi:MAG TPA: hypothetical protein VFW96_26500 [Thermomicrobiales bacterium]|nr:hypothetical protein [Thermomicrobiales bacterium]